MRGQECPRYALLVYPDGAGFFQLGMLLPEFAGYRAERNACGLREIRSRPFSLGGGVIRSADDALSRRHRRISCVFRMTRKLVALRLIADSGHAILGKCRGGGKQAEQEHGLFHCRSPDCGESEGSSADKGADVGSSRLSKSKPGTKLFRCEMAASGGWRGCRAIVCTIVERAWNRHSGQPDSTVRLGRRPLPSLFPQYFRSTPITRP